MAKRRIGQIPLHLMLLPAVVLVVIYCYVPMAGIVIAFQKFIPAKGLFGNQQWVGFKNFVEILHMSDTLRIVANTVIIAILKILVGQAVPIVLALLINEVRSRVYKKTIQTVLYLPYFLSWVIAGGILVDLLSPTNGIVNNFLGLFGIKPIFFLGDNLYFRYVMVITDVWKNAGFNTIIYLAALTSIDPTLYEAACIDGAGRWRQTLHITIPGMMSIVVLLAVLNIGNILNAGFDQIFNLYNPLVYETGDIIDTFVYRIGIINARYSIATAVGLFKSLVSFVFVALSYYLAYRVANYKVF